MQDALGKQADLDRYNMFSGYNMPQMTKKVLLTAAQKKIMKKLRNTEETLTNEELTTVLRLNEQTKPSSSPSYG